MDTLRRDGEIWTLTHDGTDVRLRDTVGLRYLAELVGAPDRELHVLDLVASAGSSEDPRGRASTAPLEAPLLDPAAKDAYRARIRQLEDEISDAEAFGDDERAARARAEQQTITEELARAIGLGGRDRTAAGASERARQSVHKALKRTLGKLAEHAPALAAHLDAAIATGTFCSYRPPGEPMLSTGVAHERRDGASHLPEVRTRLIGRQADLVALEALLADERLVTITGAAGCGKTRLAIELADRAAGRFPGGVWFVDLSRVSAPSHVVPALARALGLREEAGRALEDAVLAPLRDVRGLVVFDNCEHLLEAVRGPVTRILAEAPRVSVLCTGREALGLDGERAWTTPSLAIPTADASLEEIRVAPAVALFEERAAAVDPGFTVDEATARDVVTICARLDGIPLAIELAAARMRALGPAEIAGRLADAFQLLSGGSSSGLERHRTLRATVDWSYQLLSREEQTMLDRLSVFHGGFTVAAAEEVIPDDGIEPGDVLQLLEGLVARSLLQKSGRRRRRMRPLETIRQYAADRLAASGDSVAVRMRHRAWVERLCASLGPRMVASPDQVEALATFEEELPNIRAALEDARTHSDHGSMQRIAGNCFRGWHRRGYLSEGLAFLDDALSSGTGDGSAVRLRALLSAGHLARILRDTRAEGFFEEARALAEATGDQGAQADAIQGLALIGHRALNNVPRRRALEAVLPLAEASGDELLIAHTHHRIASTLEPSEHELAAEHLEAARLTMERLGDTAGAAGVFDTHGRIAFEAGALDEAAEAFARGHELADAVEDRRFATRTLGHLGLVRLTQGRTADAKQCFVEGLARARALGDRTWIAYTITGLGSVALSEGDFPRARAFYREGQAVRRAMGSEIDAAYSEQALGGLARAEGDVEQMRLHYVASLATLADPPHLFGILSAFEPIAFAALQAGDPERAARLMGAAHALAGSSGLQLPEQHFVKATDAAIVGTLGDERARALTDEGRALSLEDAVALATA